MEDQVKRVALETMQSRGSGIIASHFDSYYAILMASISDLNTVYKFGMSEPGVYVGIWLALVSQARWDFPIADEHSERRVADLLFNASMQAIEANHRIKIRKEEFLRFLSHIGFVLDYKANRNLFYKYKQFFETHPFYYFLVTNIQRNR